VTHAALAAFEGEISRLRGAAGGEAEAGRANVVRAFAKPPVSARLIYSICDIRRKRSQFLGGKLLGEPGWDIMLQLYAADLDQQRMSITRLTRRSGIPPTTVLRILGKLGAAGLVTRSEDPIDNRRVFVALSLAGVEAMDGFFASSGSQAIFL
jgi:DNA-binding MarR family transcriptional regulator